MILTVLVTACEPGASPREPDLAWVTLVVGADGTGTVEVHPSAAHENQLTEIGYEAGRALFPGHAFSVRIDGNAGGTDFVKVRVQDLYEPGRARPLH